MHLRAVVLLALPTLLLSQSQTQEEHTSQASTTQQETVQSRMAGAEVPWSGAKSQPEESRRASTGTTYWSRCTERHHGSDSQRQERPRSESTHQRAAEPDSSYQPERQSYSRDSHHSEESAYHPSYAPLPYQSNLGGFGYITPRRSYYEGTSINYPYQHTAAQYSYGVPNY